MEEFKPNSKKYHEDNKNDIPEKKIEKVTTGAVKVQKTSPFKKFKKRFVEEDAQNIKEAAIKIMIDGAHDVLLTFVDGLFGTTRRGRRPGTRGYGVNNKVSYIDYGGISQQNVKQPQRVNSLHNIDDYIFESRSDAEMVLEVMIELIDKYDFASVCDLKDAIGIDSNYTERNWGWNNLADARTERVNGGGYVLRLPRPICRG